MFVLSNMTSIFRFSVGLLWSFLKVSIVKNSI
nr:MAG TPA: hypothetical protein [Caudoviricetes sp.]